MLVPKSFIDDLRGRIRLSDVIAPRVKLARSGREFKGCCPFHNEKSASFYVNDEKGFFHCFGCGAHGDQIGFLMRHQNLGFMDAVEILASQAGMQVPQPSVHDVERARTKDRFITLMDAATKWYASQLFAPQNAQILAYLTGRGLTLETIESFRLGYSPAESKQLEVAMKQAGYTTSEMIEVGLMKASTREGGGAPYAFFRDRVMFPVCDRRGQTIAFGARVLPEHLRPLKEGENKPPKYINSGETALFQKGHVLYNESHARSAAARGLPVVVCEGYADVIALWQAGFTGAVAPLGTALTEAQIASLWSMMPESDATGVREPILCFDGDGAGQRAATRAVDRILPQLQAGRSIRVAFLPDGMDPDDLIRAKGAAAFEAVLNTAIPMVEMLWHTLTSGKQFATPESRAGLQKSIQDMCAPIADLAVKKQYESILKDKFYKAFRPQGKNAKSGGVAAQIVRLPDPKLAVKNARVRVALAAVLYFPEIFTQAEDLLGCLHIQDSRLDKLRQVMIEVLGDTPVIDHDLFIDIMTKKGFADDLQIVLNTGALHGASPKHGGNAGAALAGLREAVSSCH